MPTHDNCLSTCLSILMSCHVTCDTRPSASLCVPNEAGRTGNEATPELNKSSLLYMILGTRHSALSGEEKVRLARLLNTNLISVTSQSEQLTCHDACQTYVAQGWTQHHRR